MEANLVTPAQRKAALEWEIEWNAKQLASFNAKVEMDWLMHTQGGEPCSARFNAKKRAHHRAKLIAACEILDADI